MYVYTHTHTHTHTHTLSLSLSISCINTILTPHMGTVLELTLAPLVLSSGFETDTQSYRPEYRVMRMEAEELVRLIEL